jgi:signal transduction histidine kinase
MSKMPGRHGRARLQRAGPFAVSAWPLRRKVALALLIPLLLAATLGALRVRSDLVEAEDASATAKQVTILRPAVDYLTAAERAMVAAHGAFEDNRGVLDSALRDLNTAARELEDVRETADLTTEQRYQVDVLLDLTRAMQEADTTQLTRATWVAQMRLLQSSVTQLITTIVNAQIDPEPRLEQLGQALSGRFSLAMQHALASTERTGSTGSLELYREVGAELTAIDRLAGALGDSEPAIADLQTANSERATTIRKEQDLGGLGAYGAYDSLITELLSGIDDELDAAAASAERRALVDGGVTLAALLAAILLALVVSRMLLNPIRRVREGALNVAEEQLPDAVAKIRAGGDPGPIEPIDVTTNEEIGQLARAVDDLHTQAVILASREAGLRSQVSEMFVTLSRRHNSLINQQLDLIEMLERDEEDAQRLESLFRLDHLAARMRRTSESLLVLAEAPPMRASATEDLTVTAALQAATAAVKDYQRVRVGSVDNSRIRDAAAADIVHLLTELVDNALQYSSPETRVTLDSTSSAEGAVIEIADAGLGIRPETLAQLNDVLHSGGELTADAARRMGLFVVSRLAQRHGISVSLQSNQQRGITARVVLPWSVLERARPGDEAAPSRPAEPAFNPILPEQRHPSTAPDDHGLRSRPDVPTDLPFRRPASDPPEPAPVLPVPTGAARAGSIGEPVTEESDATTPIFRSIRSAWLSSSSDASWESTEVEAGWDRADQVARSSVDTQVTATGLPVRRPGNRLVPGGVTTSGVATTRDPDAIRARLAAHAEGVSRGRSAAAGSDQSPTEAPS